MATQRGYYRSELLRAIENIAMCLTHLARIVDAYALHYPEISQQAQNIGDVLVNCAEKIKELHDNI